MDFGGQRLTRGRRPATCTPQGHTSRLRESSATFAPPPRRLYDAGQHTASLAVARPAPVRYAGLSAWQHRFVSSTRAIRYASMYSCSITNVGLLHRGSPRTHPASASLQRGVGTAPCGDTPPPRCFTHLEMLKPGNLEIWKSKHLGTQRRTAARSRCASARTGSAAAPPCRLCT